MFVHCPSPYFDITNVPPTLQPTVDPCAYDEIDIPRPFTENNDERNDETPRSPDGYANRTHGHNVRTGQKCNYAERPDRYCCYYYILAAYGRFMATHENRPAIWYCPSLTTTDERDNVLLVCSLFSRPESQNSPRRIRTIYNTI